MLAFTELPATVAVPTYWTSSDRRKWSSPDSSTRPVTCSLLTDSVPCQIPPGEALDGGGAWLLGLETELPPGPPPQLASRTNEIAVGNREVLVSIRSLFDGPRHYRGPMLSLAFGWLVADSKVLVR